MHTVTVAHNFETAHRLPHLPGKCQSLHGHSWWAEVTVAADELPADQVVVEFGAFKAALRGWIDEHLDHGVMLERTDALTSLLRPHGKVYAMDGWPTVEAVALLLGRVAEQCLAGISAPEAVRVRRVRVRETHVNTAAWEPGQ